VDPDLYNHVDPAIVGNDMRILVTEMPPGQHRAQEPGARAGPGRPAGRAVQRHRPDQDPGGGGLSFEAADASFELLVRASWRAPRCGRFTLESYRVIVEHREDGAVTSEATVKVRVRGERVVATGEATGPVNALDAALRAALVRHFPVLSTVDLRHRVGLQGTDLEGSHGTGA